MMRVFFFGIGTASILPAGYRARPDRPGARAGRVFRRDLPPGRIAMAGRKPGDVGRVLGVNGVFGNVGVAFSAPGSRACSPTPSVASRVHRSGSNRFRVGVHRAVRSEAQGEAPARQGRARPALARRLARVSRPHGRHRLRRRDLNATTIPCQGIRRAPLGPDPLDFWASAYSCAASI